MITTDWMADAAREIYDDVMETLTLSDVEDFRRVIEKHCPFKQGVAYQPVDVVSHLDHSRCPKIVHDNPEAGYLHRSDDDSPYDVDGVMYCGRCHRAL